MTIQINDRVFHNGVQYDLPSLEGEGLFRPQDYGIKPHAIATNCLRGWFVLYVIENNSLLLQQLTLGLPWQEREAARAGKGPMMFGKLPVFERYAEYQNLALPIKFTGKFLVGKEKIGRLIELNGFNPAWKYQYVRELRFENGQLVEENDLSDEMERVRPEKIRETIKIRRESSRHIRALIRKSRKSLFRRILDRLTGRAQADEKQATERRHSDSKR